MDIFSNIKLTKEVVKQEIRFYREDLERLEELKKSLNEKFSGKGDVPEEEIMSCFIGLISSKKAINAKKEKAPKSGVSKGRGRPSMASEAKSSEVH